MKYSGVIGFKVDEVDQNGTGVYVPVIEEHKYTGDILRRNLKNQEESNKQNDNINVSNQISIVSNFYLRNNWPTIQYVTWNGVRFKVSNIDLSSMPRVIIDLGGIYDGKVEIRTP